MKLKSLIFATLLAFPMFANALTPEQERQIDQKMQQVITNLKTGDIATMASIMPPKVINVMAKRAKIPPKQFKENMIAFTSALAENVKFENIRYDLSKGSDGHTPLRDYKFLPYSFDMVMNGEKQSTQENLLFLSDNKQWYVVRVQYQSQLDTVKQAYPDLKDIELP